MTTSNVSDEHRRLTEQAIAEAQRQLAVCERSLATLDRIEAEARIATEASRKEAVIEANAEAQQRAADVVERAALHRRTEEAAEAARLEQAAKQAQHRADAIDPEDK